MICSNANSDKFHEECGIFGVIGPQDAAQFTALGLHALQHRGQEACGIVAYDARENTFNNVRRIGYVRDHFTRQKVMDLLPGSTALGHVRYSTTGSKGAAAIRDTQPLFAEFSQGGVAIAHNGNLTNSEALRTRLISQGSIFQSNSDTECIIHLMAHSKGKFAADRMKDALLQLEGAFSVVAIDPDQADRCPGSAWHTAAGIGQTGQWLCLCVRNLRSGCRRSFFPARSPTRRDAGGGPTWH